MSAHPAIMPRLVIDQLRGTIQVGKYVYSLDVLARGAVRAAADHETCGAATAAGAAAGEVPAGEGTK